MVYVVTCMHERHVHVWNSLGARLRMERVDRQNVMHVHVRSYSTLCHAPVLVRSTTCMHALYNYAICYAHALDNY